MDLNGSGPAKRLLPLVRSVDFEDFGTNRDVRMNGLPALLQSWNIQSEYDIVTCVRHEGKRRLKHPNRTPKVGVKCELELAQVAVGDVANKQTPCRKS